MEQAGKVNAAIELMAEHERTIGRLYSVYSDLLPDKEFWQKLAKEEEYHAKWITSFTEDVYDGEIRLSDKFQSEPIWQSIKRIKQMIEDAKDQTEGQALINALAIEDMILEKDFIDLFDEGEPSVQEVLLKLIQGTQNHRLRIEDKLRSI
ncbi:MAG: hypothetical protein WCT32_03560 [Patescibacteria group bacterium]